MAARLRKIQKRLEARIKDYFVTTSTNKKAPPGAFHKPGSMKHKG